MSEEEVDLGEETDDYEVVPVGPIRRLEKRIDNIETKAQGGGPSDDVVRDVLDIMKSNQKIVNDMTQSTHELKNEVEDLTHKMDEVVDNMNSFMDLLKDASEMDMEGEVVGDMQSRIADAVGNRMEDIVTDMQESNRQLVDSLEDINQSIKRSYAAQNKDEILERGDRRQRRSGNRQSQQQRGANDGGQGQRQTQQPEDERGQERMRKLRERFNDMNEES